MRSLVARFPWWPYWISWPTLRAFYKEQPFRQNALLKVAWYDASLGTWTTADTGLSPTTVYGAITAAYSGGYEMIAWRTSSNTVNYTVRATWIGSQWSSIMSVPAVSTNADVSLAVGSDGFRLFYRDASTGQLRYAKYASGAWGAPVSAPSGFNMVVSSGPSATWENGRYHVGVVVNYHFTVMQIVQGTPDSWQNLTTHDTCFFESSSARHAWSGRSGMAVHGNRLYTLGPVADSYGENMLDHGVATRSVAGAAWTLDAHGEIEQYGDAADLVVFGDRLWAVGYNGWPDRNASIFWKQP